MTAAEIVLLRKELKTVAATRLVDADSVETNGVMRDYIIFINGKTLLARDILKKYFNIEVKDAVTTK